MVKFILIGWICAVYADQSQKCVRMVSEVIHDNLESCIEYSKIMEEEILKENDASMSMQCTSTGVIEDYVLTIS